MPRLQELLAGIVRSDSLERITCQSAEDFIKHYEKISKSQQLDSENLTLLRCAVISKCQPILRTGSYLSQKSIQNTAVLPTRLRRLDALLNGGLYTCELTEIYGPTGQGKTQICHQICGVAALRKDTSAIYIHSSGCFSAMRLMELVERNSTGHKTIEQVLKFIQVYHISDVSEFYDLISSLFQKKKCKVDQFHTQLKLVIVDSLSAILSPIIGYKEYEGSAMMQLIGTLLKRFAVELNIAILVVNGTVSHNLGFTPKSALGIHWMNIPHNRILVDGYDSFHQDFKTMAVVSSNRLCVPHLRS